MTFSYNIFLLPNSSKFIPSIFKKYNNEKTLIIVLGSCYGGEFPETTVIDRNEYSDEKICEFIKSSGPERVVLYNCFWDAKCQLLYDIIKLWGDFHLMLVERYETFLYVREKRLINLANNLYIPNSFYQNIITKDIIKPPSLNIKYYNDT